MPHSGPFARGIHVTVQATLHEPLTTHELVHALREFYDQSVFVRVSGEHAAPQGRRRQQLRASSPASATGARVAVMCVIDNLTKGAAGGAVQWMNRMLGHEETAGLMTPAPGWT